MSSFHNIISTPFQGKYMNIRRYFTFLVFALTLLSLSGFCIEQIHRPPILTTAAIIEVYDQGYFKGIVLIERGKAPFGKALPGGKVEYGETVENAIRREMMEEVNLELHDLRQFHVYSEPTRDFRHHSVEVTHLAKAFCLPNAGDDAAAAFVIKIEDIPWDQLAFDHAQILQDYLEWKNGNTGLSMVKP